MHAAREAPTARTARRARAFGATVSVALHLLLFAYVHVAATAETLDLELALPSEVEFGVVEEVAVAAPSAPTPPPTPEEPPSPAASDEETASEEASAPPEPDAGTPPPPERVAEELTPDAGTPIVADEEAAPGEESPQAPSILEGPSRIPPGAQVAIRLDLERIRASVLAPDVRRLLDAIPDWFLLLDGSGIDPVEDLDRLLIASPNMQRSRLVLAGRHTHDEAYVRRAVASIAAARGAAAPWSSRDGIPTAPWANRDATARELAILSPHHFAITRPADLRRLLAVMLARQARDAEAEGLEAAEGPDALLSMGPGEGVSIEIEGVSRFILRRPPGMPEPPERLRAAVRQLDDQHAALEGLMTFATPEDAAAGAEWLERLRARFVDDVFVRMSGMTGALRDAVIAPDGDRVRIETTLGAAQVRLIFSYVEGALASRRSQLVPPPPRPPAPSPTGSETQGTQGRGPLRPDAPPTSTPN